MRNPELEAAIEAAPDDDEGAYAVYGDWLVTAGDPRGELIKLQLAARRAVKNRSETSQRAVLLLGSASLLPIRSPLLAGALWDHVEALRPIPKGPRRTAVDSEPQDSVGTIPEPNTSRSRRAVLALHSRTLAHPLTK